MPKVTQAHLEARRRQILQAAARAFARAGFHGTTMHDLCREAKLSPGAVYRYFSGKDAIIEALAEGGREANRAMVEEAAAGGSPRRQLETLVDRFLVALHDPEEMDSIRLDLRLWSEALHTPRLRRIQARSYATLLGLLADVVRRGQAVGEIDGSVDPRAVGRALIGIVQHSAFQRLIEPDMDADALRDAAWALLGGLDPQSRARPGS